MTDIAHIYNNLITRAKTLGYPTIESLAQIERETGWALIVDDACLAGELFTEDELEFYALTYRKDTKCTH